MARDFYPFVEEPDTDPNHNDKEYDRPPLEVRYAARIAVYDDKSTTPRVVLIDPKPVRDYLEEITDEVTKLSHEQGGSIPFMVIREIVENFIHAYFVEPTISILDGGNTIRFADQGPGIKEKDRALEYGTSSATEDMRHYIRGVGSGLPYVQQYMDDKGGTLTIDDNIGPGTVVTLSLADADHHESQNAAQPMVPNNQQNPAYLQQTGVILPIPCSLRMPRSRATKRSRRCGRPNSLIRSSSPIRYSSNPISHSRLILPNISRPPRRKILSNSRSNRASRLRRACQRSRICRLPSGGTRSWNIYQPMSQWGLPTS